MAFGAYHNQDTIEFTIKMLKDSMKCLHNTQLYKENAIIVFGYCAASFKEALVNHVTTMVNVMIKSFKNDRPSVHQSCSRSIVEIFSHVLPEDKVSRVKVLNKLLGCID